MGRRRAASHRVGRGQAAVLQPPRHGGDDGLPEEAVDYIEYDVGGGFGARGEFYPEDFLVAFAARKFGRPVKWIEDRREHFMSIAPFARDRLRPRDRARPETARSSACAATSGVDIGAYVRPNGMTPVRNVGAVHSRARIACPTSHLEAHAMITNKTPSGTYRGPGRFEGCFFIERHASTWRRAI